MKIIEERPVLRNIIHTRTLEKASKCKQPGEIHTGVKPSVTIKTYKNLFPKLFLSTCSYNQENVRKHLICLNVSGKLLAGS